MVDGDADFAGEVEFWVSGKGDDVSGGRVVQEVGVELRDGIVVYESDGEFAWLDVVFM